MRSRSAPRSLPKVLFTPPPLDGQGVTAGIICFLDSSYGCSDRTLVSASRASQAVRTKRTGGDLIGAWAANSTGNDCHTVTLIQATEAKTSPDYTV